MCTYTQMCYIQIYTERQRCVFIYVHMFASGVFFLPRGVSLSSPLRAVFLLRGVLFGSSVRHFFGAHSAWWSCAFQQVSWVCGHNAGGSDLCKVCISRFISAHLAWWSSTAQRIAWVCGNNAGGSELFPVASQYF